MLRWRARVEYFNAAYRQPLVLKRHDGVVKVSQRRWTPLGFSCWNARLCAMISALAATEPFMGMLKVQLPLGVVMDIVVGPNEPQHAALCCGC